MQLGNTKGCKTGLVSDASYIQIRYSKNTAWSHNLTVNLDRAELKCSNYEATTTEPGRNEIPARSYEKLLWEIGKIAYRA